MIIKKITTGFVIQTFDTKLGKFIRQEFVAGDDCEYELDDSTPISEGDNEEADKAFFDNEPYLPFDMDQPID